MAAKQSGFLEVVAFSTESVDKLSVAGAHYSGGVGPAGVKVYAGTNLTWESDSTSTRTGWKICLFSPEGSFHGL